jgi:hypothetical protein
MTRRAVHSPPQNGVGPLGERALPFMSWIAVSLQRCAVELGVVLFRSAYLKGSKTSGHGD